MAKSLNELGESLKSLIKDLNTGHGQRDFRPERYNNLKLSMDPDRESRPHVTITIGLSEAIYSIDTQVRIFGSLGPDEHYIFKWFNRVGTLDSLKDLWRDIIQKAKKANIKERLNTNQGDELDNNPDDNE